ncbi:MAG: hypothetical protein ACXWQQ_05155 [Pseudobdellovibrio sp.]
MKIKIISIVTLLIFMASFIEARSTSKAQIQYFLPDAKKWSRDTDVVADISGPKHFYFLDTENIDLNVVPIDDDLASSIRSRGVDQFVKDILTGKNYIDAVFGVNKTEILSYNLVKEKGRQILEINSRQLLSEGMVESTEKYYIYPGRTIQTQLNWKKAADPAQVKEARKLFADFRVESLAGPEK